MKNTLQLSILLCALLVKSACPSFAQFQGNTGNSSGSQSSSGASQFTAPNYWGDPRVKNRSTASTSQASGGSQIGGNSRGGGGGGSSMGMFMGPAMMLPMMLMGRGFRGGSSHQPKQREEDDRKPAKHHKKLAHQQSVNDDNSLPDPLYPQQGLSTVSKKTLDLQNGNAMQQQPQAQAQLEDPRMRVSGVMQDEEFQLPAQEPGKISNQPQLEPVDVLGTDF